MEERALRGARGRAPGEVEPQAASAFNIANTKQSWSNGCKIKKGAAERHFSRVFQLPTDTTFTSTRG